MKALIYCKSNANSWVKKIFSGQSPYLLQVVNKPLLEYYVDLCSLKKIVDVRIVLTDDDGSVERYFADGRKWGMDISYSLARENDTLKQVYLKNKGFCKDSELLIIEGYGFVDYDKNIDDYPMFQGNISGKVSSGDFKVYYITREDNETSVQWDGIDEFSSPGVSVSELDGIEKYYRLCLDVIESKSEKFVLPGYSSEKGVFIGQNVEIAKSCRIEKPVMIGDNVQLKNSVSIGSNTIIGNNVIIDSDATVTASIVYGNTYIGSGVEIVSKIVYKNYLISPDTGDAIEIVDSFLTSKLGESVLESGFRKFAHYFLTITLILLQIIPASLMYILILLSGYKSKVGSYIISKAFNTVRLSDYSINDGWLVGLFRRLSFDKFPLLIEAFKGNISLVGNTIYLDTIENREFITSLPNYRPGIFTYTESIGSGVDEYQCRINDSYYCYNRSFFMDVKIALRSMMNRFLNN